MEKKFVNLLQERGAPPTFWEKLYDWVTNTARIIIIITQFAVITAFGWRFKLDRELNDLKDVIEQKGGQLKLLSSQEDEIRVVQQRTDTYQQLWEQSSNITPVMEEVVNYIPSDVEDLSIIVTTDEQKKRLIIEGVTNRDDIDTLENKLKDSDNFDDATVSDIEKEEDFGDTSIFSFTMTAFITYDLNRQL